MKSILGLALLFISMAFAHADWTTDYKAALDQAKTEKKLVLLDFTGSDWCGYCKLIEKEVFSQQAFKDFADQNYILVTVDFPQETQLPDDLKQQNADLASEFKIDLYPTLIVVNADGKELGRKRGYDPGSGPDPVIAQLKSFNSK